MIRLSAVTAAALICTACPVWAQKYKTEIPPAIVTPNTLETRLGTLKFRDGVPDDETVQKVYDNLDFQRGVQAFLTAMPAASLVAMRKGIRGFGPDNQTVLIPRRNCSNVRFRAAIRGIADVKRRPRFILTSQSGDS